MKGALKLAVSVEEWIPKMDAGFPTFCFPTTEHQNEFADGAWSLSVKPSKVPALACSITRSPLALTHNASLPHQDPYTLLHWAAVDRISEWWRWIKLGKVSVGWT